MMGLFRQKGYLSANQFADVLLGAFLRMRARNIETIRILLPDLIDELDEEGMVKLDWELSILDMFNTTYTCLLLVKEEKANKEIIKAFHNKVYEEFNKTSLEISQALRNETKFKYGAYSSSLDTDDPQWHLCKEIWNNIFIKPRESAIEMQAMFIYFKANQRFIADIIQDMGRKQVVPSEWKIQWDLVESIISS